MLRQVVLVSVLGLFSAGCLFDTLSTTTNGPAVEDDRVVGAWQPSIGKSDKDFVVMKSTGGYQAGFGSEPKQPLILSRFNGSLIAQWKLPQCPMPGMTSCYTVWQIEFDSRDLVNVSWIPAHRPIADTMAGILRSFGTALVSVPRDSKPGEKTLEKVFIFEGNTAELGAFLTRYPFGEHERYKRAK